MGVWSKTNFRTKYNLDNNQFPILMVDKILSPIHIPPQEIKLSTQSAISNITSEKQYRRKVDKVDDFLYKWNNPTSTIKTKEKEQNTSKTRHQKESNNSRRLQYMTEETSNDKESMTELLYRENESEFKSEEEDLEYD